MTAPSMGEKEKNKGGNILPCLNASIVFSRLHVIPYAFVAPSELETGGAVFMICSQNKSCQRKI